jgi:hypothetical protein
MEVSPEEFREGEMRCEDKLWLAPPPRDHGGRAVSVGGRVRRARS